MKIKVLEAPSMRNLRRYKPWQGKMEIHPRVRTILNRDQRLYDDYHNHRRRIVAQMRREVLPAVFAMMRFEQIMFETDKVKAWFCHETGGGAGFPGFVLYEIDDVKLSGMLAVVHLVYEDWQPPSV
jgi:hypothetical protein